MLDYSKYDFYDQDSEFIKQSIILFKANSFNYKRVLFFQIQEILKLCRRSRAINICANNIDAS